MASINLKKIFSEEYNASKESHPYYDPKFPERMHQQTLYYVFIDDEKITPYGYNSLDEAERVVNYLRKKNRYENVTLTSWNIRVLYFSNPQKPSIKDDEAERFNSDWIHFY